MLNVKNLSIGYNPFKPLLSDINISSGNGQLLLLLGSNGIGKSTLLKTLAGLIPPIAGSIQIGGVDLPHSSPTQRAQIVSAVFTGRDFDPYITVRELIALGRYPYTNWVGSLTKADQHIIDKAIDTMSLADLAYKKVSQLSDGETQKTLIAKCLAQDSPVIIMDEPTAFLDYKNKAALFKTIKRISLDEQKLIILSTHDIATALPYCDQLLLLTEAKIFTQIAPPPTDMDTVLSLIEAS